MLSTKSTASTFLATLACTALILIGCSKHEGATQKEVLDWYNNNKDTDKIKGFYFLDKKTRDTLEIVEKADAGWPIAAMLADSLHRTGIEINLIFDESRVVAIPILKENKEVEKAIRKPQTDSLRVGYADMDHVDTLFIKGKQVLVIFSGTQGDGSETYVFLSQIKNPALGRLTTNELPCFYYMKSDSEYKKMYSLKYCDYSDGTARWFDVQKNYEPIIMQEPVLVVSNVTVKKRSN